MAQVNPFFIKKDKTYLFSEISKKVATKDRATLINLGIGDIAKPLSPAIIGAIYEAGLEMSKEDSFKGYGPASGYSFLKQEILKADYPNMHFSGEEVFIADGICPDLSNFQEIFSQDSIVGIQDPTYPLYIDMHEMAGRNIVLLPCTEENQFSPRIPETKLDIIYLCSPNNPTGVAMTYSQLTEWVNYAIKNNSIIFFDAAYAAFISDPDVPKTIYEIEGAKSVAIELKSFSKSAGFTGIRCSYSIVPKELFLFHENATISVNSLWHHRQDTKTNGVSYLSQKAAASIFSVEGKSQTEQQVMEYKDMASLLKKTLIDKGFTIYGGINSPYLWWKIPANFSAWEFFDYMLDHHQIIVVPGSGFGTCGESFVRLSSFISKETLALAIEKFKPLHF
ncbi:MAG: LL-diaminopimelate aminotransferase [Chlamydiales bacterium]|nr:LL-diaminopimelate aminotransferase [Chlamydiales bacterium]